MDALQWVLVVALFFVAVEVLFYFFTKCWLVPRLGKARAPQPPWFKDTDSLLVEVFDKLKSIEHAYSIETYVTGSFRLATLDNICTENFDSFLAWALYTSHLHHTTEDQKANIISHRNRIQDQFNLSLKEGFNSEVDHIKFNLDDMRYIHHPLSLSLLIKGMDFYSDIVNYYWQGFTHHNINGSPKSNCRSGSYWIREKRDSKKSPIVFFHGICSGWMFYAKIVEAISSDRTIILYDNNSTKLNSLSFSVSTAQEVNHHILHILKKHNVVEKITLFGHSWGTYLAGWIIRLNPQIVQHLVLIDPVCFVATFPETVYTVLYKPSVTCDDYLLAYFLRSDLTLSHTLHRHVAWYNIFFSFDYIPSDIAVTVGLASGDILLSFAALDEMVNSFMDHRDKLRAADSNRKGSHKSVVGTCSKLSWNIPHAESMTSDTCIAEIKLKLYEFDNEKEVIEANSENSFKVVTDNDKVPNDEDLKSPLLKE